MAQDVGTCGPRGNGYLPAYLKGGNSMATRSLTFFVIALSWLAVSGGVPGHAAPAGAADLPTKLQGFDAYMEQLLRDWNGVGVGVGVVSGEELVFAKGYGYRDYGRKLPFDRHTLFAIGSNTKLFTAVAAGLLVEEGKLSWDQPLGEAVPQIRFHDPEWTNAVSLRDMLSHRTGIPDYYSVWYDSGLTSREIFERLRYYQPSAGLRTRFLYNNSMYAAAGYLIELKSGLPWEAFVRQRILEPLAMSSTALRVASLKSAKNAVVPYTERGGSRELYPLPIWEAADVGAQAAGTIVSNLEDLSHWLIALMNAGRYQDRQVLPPAVLEATLEPAMSIEPSQSHGWWGVRYAQGGMGRWTADYRGHLLAVHAGGLPGFYSWISHLPDDKVGVIVLVIGDHAANLNRVVGYQLYDRWLGLEPVPWSERRLEAKRQEERESTGRKAVSGGDRSLDTKPSHALADYVGEYEHPAYGTLRIDLSGRQLQLEFHRVRRPLVHYHYDRFETSGGEITPYVEGYSLTFSTSPPGTVDRVTVSIDEREATFERRH